MNILYIDIETSPLTTYTWGFYNDSALKIVEDWKILGAAYAWNDEDIKSIYPNKPEKWAKDPEKQERKVLQVLWKLLDEADIVVAHNGDRFDIKKINARLLEQGFTPPSPYQTIDTYKVAKKHFGISVNKLDYIGEYLGFGNKLKTSGLDMWLNCIKGDKAAWKEMEEYNKRDVELLRNVYYKLRPWIAKHPHMGNIDTISCPNCGSQFYQFRGMVRMKSGLVYQRIVCTDCGSWFRQKTSKGSPETRS